jgi:phage baseplate assembly protein W
MAIVNLNNIVKPKQSNKPNIQINTEIKSNVSVYTDLHLDMVIANNIGLGDNSRESKDILVDNDIEAIKNSFRNFFSTKKGEKLLTPQFGCNLERFLFEAITQINAQIIGEEMLKFEKYEPRITIQNINVVGYPDDNEYRIQMYYSFNEIKKQTILDVILNRSGQITF